VRAFYNAKIHTQNPRQPTATALAYAQGRIIAVGSDDEILAMSNLHQKKNLNGQIIWPGLCDAHIHLENYGLSLQIVNCETETRQECLESVENRARQTPKGGWLMGHGWNHNRWEGEYGSRQELDAITQDHPVYLTSKSLHAAWVNSAALKAASITADTPDPEGGKILHDQQGQPTGILLESAMTLVQNALPPASMHESVQAIDTAQRELWKLGITAVHDFDRAHCFTALQILHADQKLKLRVMKSIPKENLDDALRIGLRHGFGDEMLFIGPVKVFADGALGPRTAAMLRPYEQENQYRGMLFIESERVLELGMLAARCGLSLSIHAIGDRANRSVLDGYEQLREYENQNHLVHQRHRIEHVQIIDPADQHRLSQLDIIASMQPVHAPSDMNMADRYWGKRSENAYAWRTVRDLGTRLAFGSDAPVESPNPFLGLHAAVTRCRPDGSPGPLGWYPQQRLSLQEALDAYTHGAAFAAQKENCQGMLAPGYYADLLFLPQDPFTAPTQSLPAIRPTATMLAGEWVWNTTG
jgi:predicted amidohydrolase YtcJ